MIYVVEMIFGGENHFMANSSIVKILTGINGENKVEFYGDAEQGALIKKLYKNESINVNPLRVQGNPRLYFLPLFILYQLAYYLKIFRKCKPGDAVVISCIFAVTHYLLKIIKKIFPKVRLLIILHGEVEFISGEKKPILKLLGKFLRKALAIKNDPSTKYLVYGESIRNNMIKSKYVNEDDIIAIDHPYNFQSDIVGLSNKRNEIIIGAVGTASAQKNSQYIFELGSSLKDLIFKSKLKLKIIGNLSPEIYSFANDFVEYSTRKTFIERLDFDYQILTLDYVVYFYDNNFYKFTASGAFFDAVKFEKPIISIDNDYINYYFKKFGNIGFLCKNLQEVKEVIQNIVLNPDHNCYLEQKKQLKKAKEVLSIESITTVFWEKAKFLKSDG